jgi:hypothetical protein
MKKTLFFKKILYIGILFIITTPIIGNELEKKQTRVENEIYKHEVTFILNSSFSNTSNSGSGTHVKWYDENSPGLKTPIFKNGQNSIYGIDFIPTISKQTYDLMRHNNDVIYNNIIREAKPLAVGESSLYVGVDTSFSSNDSYDNVLGYKTNINSAYFAIDHQIHEQLRLGKTFTIGTSNHNYKDSSSERDDIFFQGTFYLDHKNKENLRFISMLSLGKTNTDFKRHYDGTLKTSDSFVSGTGKSTMDNYYVGFDNRVSKRYDVEKHNFYYEPRFNFNISYLMQDEINESGVHISDANFNGLEIDKKNSYSMRTSLGIALGKDLDFKENGKLNLEFLVSLEGELGKPYEDLYNSSNFNDRKTILGVPKGDTNEINGYDYDYITLSTEFNGYYKLNDTVNIYGGLGYSFGEEEEEIYGGIGASYSMYDLGEPIKDIFNNQENNYSKIKEKNEGIFPLFRENIEARDIHLPLPFGVSILGNVSNVDTYGSDLKINDISLGKETVTVDGDLSAQVTGLMLDFYPFPFLNVYGYGGYIRTSGDLEIGLGKTSRMVDFNEDGKLFGLGYNLAGGYKNFFAGLNSAYSFTKMSKTGAFKETFLITPRIGIKNKENTFQTWVGLMYMNKNSELRGDAPAGFIGDSPAFSYTLQIEGPEFAPTVGFRYEPIRHFEVVGEVFLAQDFNGINLRLGYRF